MSPITFTSPRTSRVYLHGPFSRRLIYLVSGIEKYPKCQSRAI